MKAILILSVLLVSTFAITHKMTQPEIRSYEALKQDKKWASILMNLAELHMMAEGPVGELIEAIDKVVADLSVKLDKATKNFEIRTEEHNSEVDRLNSLIAKAKTDISDSQTLLSDVLYPQQKQLEQEIVNLESNIKTTKQYIVDSTALREKEHEEFNNKVAEHNKAVEAIDEALEILGQLKQTDVSLVQVKRAKTSLDRVKKHLGKNIESTFVKALVALATSQFTDQDALGKVFQLLEDVKSNLIASLAKLNDDEKKAQEDFEKDMKQKESDLIKYNQELNEKQEDLQETIESIDSTLNFISIRKVDLANFEQDLVDENAAYEEATNVYNDLVAQFNVELDACAEAKKILGGADFADYIGKRMQMDKMIDTKHGEEIETKTADMW